MNLLAPFLIGLFSSVHCLAMCGGLCGLFCGTKTSWQSIILINLGRIITYTLLGVIFAGIVHGLALSIPVAEIGFWIRSFLGLILIFLGLRIILNKGSLHSYFSNNFLWQKAQTTLHELTKKHSALAHIAKGMLWGFIPCGLLYGVLIAAATSKDVFHGGAFMFAFGLGTLPSMLVAAGIMKSWQQRLQAKTLRYSAGLFIIIIGVWSLASPWFSHQLIPNHPVFTSIAAFLDSCVP
jgi:sulfite exporter TauE/SafE